MRRLVAETSLEPRRLVLPLFVREGAVEARAIPSMPGVVQHTRDTLRKVALESVEAGVGGLMLFGIPASRDPAGSGAEDPRGVLNTAIRDVVAEVGDATVVMADLCLDEFTSHGHCGVIAADGTVDNDATLRAYERMALAQADAGVHVVGPSGMMDGQVGAIRGALDGGGFHDVAILAYAAKYASALYGPFRDAAECAPQFGDRRGYQMDPPNAREALDETALDVAEGADMVMVKPALPYLDVVRALRDSFDVPVAAYHVSGEYAMLKAAAGNGLLDGDAAALEVLTSIKRAGADFVLTYLAREVAERLS